MIDRFEKFIYHRVIDAKPSEVQEILSIFSEHSFEKGDFFKERDSIIEELGFLVSGSARSYVVNESGVEITGQIAVENQFLSEIISVRSKKKTPITIEFLEKSEVVMAPMVLVRDLLRKNLVFNILIREYMGDRAADASKILFMFLTGTAKDRYQYLMETYPELLIKFPLKYIASMIGVTPTQLSRIRNEKS